MSKGKNVEREKCRKVKMSKNKNVEREKCRKTVCEYESEKRRMLFSVLDKDLLF